MMREIVRSSLRYPLLVVLVAGVLMAVGVTQLPKSRVDVLPEVSPPYVQVQTEALGLSAIEVEQLVTAPMEQQLLNGVAFLDEIYSESVPGLSSIEMFFEPGTDVFQARQLVQERLTQGQDLPNVSKAPVMLQPLSSTSRLMMVGLDTEELSLIEMSVLARWKIKPRLMGIPGVANVAIWGQREQQLQVQVDPDRLAQNGVTLNQVIHTAGNALWVSPLSFLEASAPGSGGFVDTPNQRIDIQHILPIRTSDDLGQVSLEKTDGRRLRISDVATVVEDHQPLIGDAVVADEPSLMLVVEKFPNASTVQVTRDVEAAIADMQPGMAEVTMDTTILRPASFIESALDNIGLALLIGAVLLIGALTALLFAWRVVLISMLAMVTSLLVAGLLLHLRDGTFNTAVLVGLAIALGVVVDDAIVDIEEIRRRLRTSRGSETTSATILRSSLALRGPLMFATVALVLSAAPLLLLEGVAGALVTPVIASYLLAIAASLAVALTVTPALAVLLLRGSSVERPEPPLARWIRRGYAATLARLYSRPAMVSAAAAVFAVAGLIGLPQLGGQSVLPNLQDRTLLVRWEAAPGTSHPEMTRITARVSSELRAIPGVANVGAHVGRAITGDTVSDVNAGNFWVSLDEDAEYAATTASVQRVVDGYPGVAMDVDTYSAEVLAGNVQSEGDDLTVRVFGHNMGVLRAKAKEARRLITGVEGVVQPHVDARPTEPTIEIEVDLKAAERYGIKPGEVRRAAATLVSGIEVGNLFEEQKVFEVVVWGSPDARNSLNSVHALPIDLPGGGQVRLDQVADVSVTPNLTEIEHAAVSRHVDVVADITGDRSEVLEAVQARVGGMQFPLEHHAEVLDNSTTGWAGSLNTVLTLGAAAVILIFLLLQAAFSSWTLATMFFLTLPLSLVGAVVAAVAAGDAFFLGSLMGLFTLLGLALRNGIVLIRRYQALEEAGDVVDAAAILRASADRVVPVVTVAAGLSAVLLPIAVLGTAPGYEVLRPVALVVLGGLVTSTLVTLLILPLLYIRVRPYPRHGAVMSTATAGPARG